MVAVVANTTVALIKDYLYHKESFVGRHLTPESITYVWLLRH